MSNLNGIELLSNDLKSPQLERIRRRIHRPRRRRQHVIIISSGCQGRFQWQSVTKPDLFVWTLFSFAGQCHFRQLGIHLFFGFFDASFAKYLNCANQVEEKISAFLKYSQI